MNRKRNRFVFAGMLMSLFLIMAVDAAKAEASRQTDSDRPIDDGTYKVVSAINHDYVWDIANGSTDDGANLQLYTDNGTDAQKFTFTYLSDGYYFITNAKSAKAIGSSEDDAVGGVNLRQSSFINADTQCWKLISGEDGYYTFICKDNDMAADVEWGMAENGRNIQAYQQNQTVSQKFRLINSLTSVNDVDQNSSAEPVEHARGFFYAVAFLILGAVAAVVIGIGYFSNNHIRKKK